MAAGASSVARDIAVGRGARVLVVAHSEQYANWLRHHIEIAQPGARIEVIGFDDLRRRRASLTRRDCELLVLVADFSASGSECEGLDWLRRLSEQPAFPGILAIAENGDELVAVRALRAGAADYLPRRLLTAERLAQSIGTVLSDAVLRQAGAAPRYDMAPLAAEQAPLSATLPRDLIPRYTLLQKLGESERATVYLARSAGLARNVALKVTRSSGDDAAHFAHEYQSIGALSHPAIVEIYDYGVHDGREYIAMEYFPCGDLKARLQNPISEGQSLDYLRRIATALSVVHEAGIVHRDLKPPNVMLREDGQVVLIDFGIAKNLANLTHSTAAGLLRGSPYYMSPEQAQGTPLDVRSDLYSLGVILYEMLVGAKPYVGATAMDVLQQHVAAQSPLLPLECQHRQALLDRLMAKSPDARFDSAQQLLQALENA